jgi:hypothetical protein
MPAAFAIWVCGCAYLNCAGWLLSACHQLNPLGYALALLPGIFLAWSWLKKNPPAFRPQKYFRRCRRLLPAIFFLLAALVFLGGILYAPSNFDALTYRLPRMLNWLTAGHWFWIPTINKRMNYSGAAWEWVALPFLALLKSDRGMFLINALGFLLMPGLLFAIFRQLGVARKVAWAWMWLLPLAYGYITQAGSIGNDFTGTLFYLLSVHFGLRARRSGRVTDLWLAILAAALLTGVKLSNLPLALPCLVAIWPALPQLRKHLVGSIVMGVMAVVISALPMVTLNQIYTGSWNGDPQNEYRMQIKNPVAGLLGNGFLLAEQSLVPPVLPGSNKIHQRLYAALPAWLKTEFPRMFSVKINELPGEEGAGLNLAITLPLLLVSVAALVRCRRTDFAKKLFSLWPPVVLAAWVALLVCMAKLGSEAGPRLMLPYYPLVLIPWLLLSAQSRLLRWRAWRVFLVLLAVSTLPVLVLSMARPLWPAQTITAQLARAHPDNQNLQRLATTYTAYAHRNDILAPLRAGLPADAREIGFIAGSNDTSYSLWRPFGQHQVVDLRTDIRRFLAQPNVEWVVVKADIWPEISSVPLEQWAQEHHAQIMLNMPIVQLVSAGPETWCVLHIPKLVQPAEAAAP